MQFNREKISNIFLASVPVDSVSFNIRNLNLGGKISDNVWCLIVRRGDLGDPSWHILFMLSLVVVLAAWQRCARPSQPQYLITVNTPSQNFRPDKLGADRDRPGWLWPGLTWALALSISHQARPGQPHNYQNEILTKLRLQVHQFDIQWKYDWCRGEPLHHTTPHTAQSSTF